MMRHCRYCGAKGHNRRTCHLLTPEQKAITKLTAKVRTCSYCGDSGHTRPTCIVLKGNKINYIKENAAFRARVLDNMAENGLGVGSLITLYDKYYKHHGAGGQQDFDTLEGLASDDLYLLESISWDDIQSKNCYSRPLMGRGLTSNGSYGYSFRANAVNAKNKANEDHGVRVLTRRPADEIRASVPKNWLDGSSGIENIFKGKRSRRS